MTTTAQDPAAAAPAATDLAGPDIADEFSPAAVRDICRRAAYDMGIQGREAHPEMLPAIAAEAARRMTSEVRGNGAARRTVPGHVAGMDILAALPGHKRAWVMDHRGREFRHESGASFSFGQNDETITIHFSRQVRPSGVETIHLDRPTTTAARIAGVIAALLTED